MSGYMRRHLPPAFRLSAEPLSSRRRIREQRKPRAPAVSNGDRIHLRGKPLCPADDESAGRAHGMPPRASRGRHILSAHPYPARGNIPPWHNPNRALYTGAERIPRRRRKRLSYIPLPQSAQARLLCAQLMCSSDRWRHKYILRLRFSDLLSCLSLFLFCLSDGRR